MSELGELDLGPLPSPGGGYVGGGGRRGTYGLARFSTVAGALPALTPSPGVHGGGGGFGFSGVGVSRMSLAPGQLAPSPAGGFAALVAGVSPEVRARGAGTLGEERAMRAQRVRINACDVSLKRVHVT
jgi:hypothetical protein